MRIAIRKHFAWIAILAALALMFLMADLVLGHAHLIKGIAHVGKQTDASTGKPTDTNVNTTGLDNFIDTANALLDPAAVAMAAIAPLACLVGAGALMFGSRRGLVIIGAALGTLVFVVSVKGIVA